MKALTQSNYNEHQHQQFQDDGYVRLGQVITNSDLKNLRERIDDLMLGRITIAGITFQLDGKRKHMKTWMLQPAISRPIYRIRSFSGKMRFNYTEILSISTHRRK